MTKYSHSRLNTFDQCALKYKYRYIDKIKVKFETIEAFMGKRVHEALEDLYKIEGETPSEESVLDNYTNRWETNYTPDIKIVKKGKQKRDYYETGKLCLVNYYRRHHPFDQSKTVGLESYVEASLDDANEYRMMGFVDRLSINKDGVYEIHDYKTSNSLPSQADIDLDRQLALYQMAVQQKYKDASSVQLIWHFLAHDKEIKSNRTEAEIDELKVQTIAKINEVEGATNFPYNETPLCGWCEYQEICPAKKGLNPANTSINENEEGLVENLTKLAKERTQLMDRLKNNQEKTALLMSELKERPNNSAVLSGKDYDLHLTNRTWYKYVGKKDDIKAFHALVKALKKEELLIQVATDHIDTVLNSGDWSEEDVEAIKPFLKIEQTKTFTLKKK